MPDRSLLHGQIGEELGEPGVQHLMGKGDAQGTFFAGRGSEALVQGTPDDDAGGGPLEPQNLGHRATGDFSLQTERLEQALEVFTHFWFQIDAGEAEVILDAVNEIERRDEIGHEGDLLETAIKEEVAEAGERGVAQVAPAIKIIGARLVGFLQMAVVGGSRAGKATG